MYCQKCGKEVSGNYCSNCGAAVVTLPNDAIEQTATEPITTSAPDFPVKKVRSSKPLHIIGIILSILNFFATAYLIFTSALSFDVDYVDVTIWIAACCAPFSLSVLLGSAFRGKSKIVSSIFYMLSIFPSIFLCCINVAYTGDFLISALLTIPFVVCAWIFGNRCVPQKTAKVQILAYALFVALIGGLVLYLYSGEIALNHAASELFEGMAEYSFMDEVETAKNLFE